jgi:hypothetical protein
VFRVASKVARGQPVGYPPCFIRSPVPVARGTIHERPTPHAPAGKRQGKASCAHSPASVSLHCFACRSRSASAIVTIRTGQGRRGPGSCLGADDTFRRDVPQPLCSFPIPSPFGQADFDNACKRRARGRRRSETYTWVQSLPCDPMRAGLHRDSRSSIPLNATASANPRCTVRRFRILASAPSPTAFGSAGPSTTISAIRLHFPGPNPVEST